MKNLVLGAVLATTMFAAVPAFAGGGGDGGYNFWDASRWEVRGRAIGVVPDESSHLSIAGRATVSNDIVPEVDVTHYVTPNIGFELIAAVSKHTLQLNGSTDLGTTVILPPTLTAQYHFMPDSAFNPYLGAGVNYSTFFNSDNKGAYTKLEVSGGWGTALQAGFDYWLNDNWGVNLDVKKLFLNVDAKVNYGAVRADVDLDPWIIGTGVSYRF